MCEGYGAATEPKWPGIWVVGLTGGIASGKSTVSNMLAQLGAIIIDADRISREVTAPGSPGLEKIREAFGDEILGPGDVLDRHKLARIIFHNDSARKVLDSIIHPLVIERVKQFLRELQDIARSEGRTRIAVVDAPLLFEAGADFLCDEVWVVAISRDEQAARLIKREGYSMGEALARIDAQMSLSEKERRATVVIDNSGTVEDTRQKIRELWDGLQTRALR